MSLALLTACIGLFAASVLSLGHLLDIPIPCGASRGCVAVANHPSSRVAGVPIAYAGAAIYIVLLALLMGPATRPRRTLLLLLTGAGTAVSAFLLVYSKKVIGATCPWCVASGIAMTALFLLAIPLRRSTAPPPTQRLAWSLAAATAIAVGVQAGLMDRAANKPPVSQERLAQVTPEELIDPAKSIGPHDAPLTVVIFADMWCPACRAAYAPLREYQRTNPDLVRLVYRHLPLWEIRGHELSGAAAALSEIAGESGKCWAFLDALHHLPQAPGREQFLSLMASVGVDGPEAERRIADMSDPAVERVYADRALADRLGITSTPSFIVMLKGRQPVSANQRTLPRLLNSPPVILTLAAARAPDRVPAIIETAPSPP